MTMIGMRTGPPYLAHLLINRRKASIALKRNL